MKHTGSVSCSNYCGFLESSIKVTDTSSVFFIKSFPVMSVIHEHSIIAELDTYRSGY